MPYCPECGEEVEEGATFCRNCGASQSGGESGTKRVTKSGGSDSTSLDMSENIEAALSYLLFWLTGIVFLIIEEKNQFVRFHAMQSIVTFLPITILGWFFGMLGGSLIWTIGFGFFAVVSWLIWLLALVLWLILMVKAYNGEYYKLPIAGEIAEDQVGKI